MAEPCGFSGAVGATTAAAVFFFLNFAMLGGSSEG